MSEHNVETIVAVFDTNILVRMALAKTAAAKRLLKSAQTGQFRLVVSEAILAELERVLRYPRIAKKHNLTDKDIREFLDILREISFITEDLYEVSRVKADPTDNIFLACALESYADYLVTEDPHLRNVNAYHGVRIIGIDDFNRIIVSRR